MSRAQWTWQLLAGTGAVLDRPLSPTFTSRFDAEAWLGEHWRRLADENVAEAQLRDSERSVGVVVRLHVP
jgi:hypothetical protein